MRVEEQRLDGAGVALDTSLYLPATTPAPAVLVAHGFGGTKASVDADARDLAARGFVVLTWTARGFGASSGQIALDAPDAEVADARRLVDWLATRPEVQQDGPGDPRVGVTGGSYGGALSLMLAGYDQRVDAIAPVITWNDLAQALFPNAATAEPLPADTPARGAFAPNGVFKRGWAGVFFASRPLRATAAGHRADLRPVHPGRLRRLHRGRDHRADLARHRGAAGPLLARVGHRPDHRAHPARPGRAGHAVRPRPGRRQRPPDRRARHPGQGHLVSRAGTTAAAPTRPSATRSATGSTTWLAGGETAPDLGVLLRRAVRGAGGAQHADRAHGRRAGLPGPQRRRRDGPAGPAAVRRPAGRPQPGGRQPRRDHVAARPRWRARRGRRSAHGDLGRAPRPVRAVPDRAGRRAADGRGGAAGAAHRGARARPARARGGGAVRRHGRGRPGRHRARCWAARSRRCGWRCPPTESATVTVTLPGVVAPVEAGHTLVVTVATTDQGYAGDTDPAVWRIGVDRRARPCRWCPARRARPTPCRPCPRSASA